MEGGGEEEEQKNAKGRGRRKGGEGRDGRGNALWICSPGKFFLYATAWIPQPVICVDESDILIMSPLRRHLLHGKIGFLVGFFRP